MDRRTNAEVILARALRSKHLSDPEPWVSVEDVARHLGISKDALCRWIEARSLPAHKIGCHWKLKLSDIDEWVRAGGAGEDPTGETA